MKIKVEPFLMKKGNRVAKAAIEFESNDGDLKNFHLVGFTICDDPVKGLFVLFPSSSTKVGEANKPYFFLRPSNDEDLDRLEDAILDAYEKMTLQNRPRVKESQTVNQK